MSKVEDALAQWMQPELRDGILSRSIDDLAPNELWDVLDVRWAALGYASGRWDLDLCSASKAHEQKAIHSALPIFDPTTGLRPLAPASPGLCPTEHKPVPRVPSKRRDVTVHIQRTRSTERTIP